MSDYVIIPSRGDGYVEMSRTKTGRLFKKHVLSKGNLLHPVTGAKIVIDDAFVSTLTDNFRSGVCDIVQIPVANDKNEHSEDPTRNIGEVVDLKEENGKIYAYLDVRDSSAADKLGRTMLGVSAMLSTDYTDTKTGRKVGPTLLHTCVTNRPYVTGLDDYQEIVAATADSLGNAVLLTEAEEPNMPTTLEELLAQLSEEHGIDVLALQTKAAEADSATALSQALSEALAQSGVVRLSNGENLTQDDIVGAVSELAQGHLTLTATVSILERKAVESEVDLLVADGRILPAARDAQVDLKLSNPEMFDRLLPEKPIVPIGKEKGVTPPEDESHKKRLDDEIARLTGEGGAAAQYVRSAK